MTLLEPEFQPIQLRLDQLIARRAMWDTHWQDVDDIVWPDSGGFTTKRTPGQKVAYNVYDPTAALDLEKFAAVMETLLTPRGGKWHKLRASDEELNKDTKVQRWFEDVTNILFTVRNDPQAAFYSQKHEGYKSLGAFGNECLFVAENPEGGIVYKNCHIGRVYVEIDNQGRVDTIFFVYPLSAKAAVQQFGADLLKAKAPKVFNMLERRPFEEADFLHVVSPRYGGYDPERADIEGMPWQSIDVSMLDRSIMALGGYRENPYIYSRYTVNPTEHYGRGPAMLVLPAIKVLQEMEKTHLRAGHKVADPPLLVYDDDIFGTGQKTIRLMPGGANYGGLDDQGRELIKPLHTGARLDITEGMMDKKREQIDEAFLVPIFQVLVDNPNMTATQALLIAQQQGMLQAPIIGRQQTESLGPLIQRELSILLRQGKLPPMPEVLAEAEGDYRIEYESEATHQARSGEVVAITRTLEVMAPMIEANPGLLRVMKDEDAFRRVADISGVAPDLVNTEEEMEEIHEAQAEAAEQQQAAEAFPGTARGVKDLATAAEALPPEAVAAP
jgi:hypothetical protein